MQNIRFNKDGLHPPVNLAVKRLNENIEGREYANMHFLQQQSLHR